MKRNIALFTEWAWANGLLAEPSKLNAFAHVVYSKILEHYPHANGYKKAAIPEIERDIWRCLKVLSYGGKKPSQLSKERVCFLTEKSHDFFKAA
ncbi:hypothetical protein GW915_02465 [bacterium]|nr:hypothetical protein [bacterium]